jgi:low affinity Fe/Cu permease
MKQLFRGFAESAATAAGTHWAFILALLTVGTWAVTGPYFGYSDTWQLFINTGDDNHHLPDGVPDPKHAKP